MAMAKKQKRKGTSTAVTSPVSPRSTSDFNPDYSYIIQDLKRIGILAVSFTGILVILSFILN